MAKENISGNQKQQQQKPAHEIYQDLFIKQEDTELTETFLKNKKTLFAQLPPPAYLERQQLDMIYSSLHEKIREKVPRDSVQTFDELLQAAKRVEAATNPVKKRIRCNYCRNAGHTADVCRKKDANESEASITSPMWLTTNSIIEGARRTTLKFHIDDIADEGILGNCAASCVASYELYTKLKARGYKFTPCRDIVNTVGSSKEMDFLKVTCNVKLPGHIIQTTFVIFPKARNSETVLGIPIFSILNIDFYNKTYHFDDNPTKKYPLSLEPVKKDNFIRTGVLTFG